MKEHIFDALEYKGDYGSHPNKSMLPKLSQVADSYWSHIQALVASQDTKVFSYDLEDGLPGYYVFWMSSYFIYDPKQGYCLSLVGSCSDKSTI